MEYGDAVMSAVTFPAEFRSLQAHYPIVFRKSQDGTTFEPVALFGFEEGQNLFLGPHGWDAVSYTHLDVYKRQVSGRA